MLNQEKKDRSNMTLDTAKRIVQEKGDFADKEARSVVRGGMNICEETNDGRRVYKWIKVCPTKTDGESSINQALMKYQSIKNKKPNDVKNPLEPILPHIETSSVETSSERNEELNKITEEQSQMVMFWGNLKRKLRELWEKIDECVVE